MKEQIRQLVKWKFNKSDFPRITPKKLFVSIIGIALVCIGVAFNNNTMFGNDPVGMVYDGIRSTLHYNQAELGVVSNYINIGLILILLILWQTIRKYWYIIIFDSLWSFSFFW